MKYPGLVAWCLAGLFATGQLFAQNAPAPAPSTTAPLANGKIQAFIVVGNVQLVDKGGTATPLVRSQTFEEGNIIKAGKNGQALLIFSNGLALKVLPNCQISVDQFQQAPFDEAADGTFLRLTKDPSKSVVSLDLRNGPAQFRALPLNVAAGSSFTINTPAGSFSAHGEVFSLSVRRNAAGQVIKVLGNSFVGALLVAPSHGSSFATNTPPSPTIPAGGQIQLQVEPTTGQSKVFGSGIPPDYSQDKINSIWNTIGQAWADYPSSFGPPPPPKAPLPTPPAGWPLVDFDPDPDGP